MKYSLKSSLALGAGILAVVGVVVAPAAMAANTTTVTATVNKTASIATTSGAVGFTINPTAAGSFSSASDTVTAGTNSTAGYVLQISAATPALTNGGNTLAASAGTAAAPVALLKNTWGYRVDNGTAGFGAATTTQQTDQASLMNTWAGVTSTATTIKTTSAQSSADTTTVWYGAGADFSKPNGAYATTVTYTAVAN